MAPITRPSRSPLVGPVLVTGGCGFLGYHLVAHLLADPDLSASTTTTPSSSPTIHVLDLDISRNTHAHPAVTYTRGSLTDEPALAALLSRLRPTAVLHAASPNATYGRVASFHAVNVRGTETLLRLARQSPHVRALVYTSTLDAYADPPHRHVTEAHPLWPARPRPWAGVGEYDRTKAIAHRLVLAANTPDGEAQKHSRGDEADATGVLKTAVIVPSHIWGLRDSQGLSLFFDMFADSAKPLWQVGRGDNLMSCVEVGNCARAHILAARALLLSSSSSSSSSSSVAAGDKVEGEAFNVTDGEDVSFWGHTRELCSLIRSPPDSHSHPHPHPHPHPHHQQDDDAKKDEEKEEKWHTVPPWLLHLAAALLRWALLLLTLGTNRVEPPPMLTRNGVSWCTEEHTLDDAKARTRLGYRPDFGGRTRREVMAEAVEWERERRRRAAEREGGGEKRE